MTAARAASLAQSCLETTRRIMRDHPFRVAGSEECRASARRIAAALEESCDVVTLETFTLHPKALWYVGKAIAVAYATGTICWLAGGPFIFVGGPACTVAAVYAAVQYVFQAAFFDRFFPKDMGCNVVGTLEPREDARQQVILVGHHDSPYIFSFLSRFQRVAFIRFLLGILAALFLTVSLIVACVQGVLGGGAPALSGAPLWITLAGLPFALPLFFMMSRQLSPGAGDNLNATSMAMTLAGLLSSRLERTRLIVLSTDGEEIGQRGAEAFACRHVEELRGIPTVVVNTDSLYRRRDLAVLTRDRNCTLPLSAGIARELSAEAAAAGIALRRMPLPFGGGGTDAAPFARRGVAAVTLIGMPTGLVSRDHLYHTERDTPDCIEPEAVAAVLDIVERYIQRIDARGAQ